MDELLSKLAELPAKEFQGRLYRCVTRDSLEGGDEEREPRFLFTSGRPNRYNPADVECVYWGESMEAAMVEFQRYFGAAGMEPVPFTTYTAEARLNILDLTDAATLAALAMEEKDLHAPWRTSAVATVTQELGQAVSLQRRFSGIRYPSDAARGNGQSATNLVIFKESVELPDWLKVFTGELPAQWWPEDADPGIMK